MRCPGERTMPNNTVRISVKFVTIMQDYSGRRLVEMDVPPDPGAAMRSIIDHF